jgi:quercetin dioxygenase-like cupin family protein
VYLLPDKIRVSLFQNKMKGEEIMKAKSAASALCAVLMVSLFSCGNRERGVTMEQNAIFGKGNKASQKIFSNTGWVKMLHTDEDKVFDTQVYNVTFDSSARTHWHSHPGGQILLATQGRGYYQEKGKPARLLQKGDVVAIAPDVVHWHGAAPQQQFIHVGMSTRVHEGPAEWFGPVTDKQYAEATNR